MSDPRHAKETCAYPLNVFCLELVKGIVEHFSPLALILLPGDVVSGLHFPGALAIIPTRPFLLELLRSGRLCLLHSYTLAFSTSYFKLDFSAEWMAFMSKHTPRS